jgi:L-alanine-DL-glutamate epimerase-like enolase superfamily enzyme
LGTSASLHAALAIPNVTRLEAPRANRDAATEVTSGTLIWPYPEIVDEYALSLDGPGLRIGFNETLVTSKPFVPAL